MARVKALVLTGYGTNCEQESAYAARQAGADEAQIAYFSDIASGHLRMEGYNFLIFPGGFLDGDDLGSAKAQANRLRYAKVDDLAEHLIDQFIRFIDAGKLILGVCNGFQLMVKMGLLPAIDGAYLKQSTTLTFNDCGRFQDRWVYLKVDSASPAVYTKGVEKGLYLPIRHGEGKFVVDGPATLAAIEEKNLAVFKYSDAGYSAPTMEFPLNPNGSVNAIAALCNETGRLMGMMPHPEAFVHRTHHPRWTREELPEEGDGLVLFRNAAEYVKTNLL